jgi:hypothetical protein
MNWTKFTETSSYLHEISRTRTKSQGAFGCIQIRFKHSAIFETAVPSTTILNIVVITSPRTYNLKTRKAVNPSLYLNPSGCDEELASQLNLPRLRDPYPAIGDLIDGTADLSIDDHREVNFEVLNQGGTPIPAHRYFPAPCCFRDQLESDYEESDDESDEVAQMKKEEREWRKEQQKKQSINKQK